MAVTCGQITKSLVLAQCGIQSVALDSDIYLINYDDVDRTASKKEGGVITDLILKSGASAYKYESNQKAFEGTSAISRGTYSVGHEHSVVGRIFENSQDIKDELDKLSNGKFVAIVKNTSNKYDATKYEVYGWDSGLVVTALDKNTTDSDGVFYSFTLGSDDGSKETSIPASFFKTDLTSTEAALNSLLTPSSN